MDLDGDEVVDFELLFMLIKLHSFVGMVFLTLVMVLHGSFVYLHDIT